MEFKFKSMKDGATIIKINDGTLTIERPGLLSKISHGFSGEKNILIKNITSVQFKKAGISRGYIQFTVAGTIEKTSGNILGKSDENIVYFDSTFNNKETNKNIEDIKKYIEEYNNDSNNLKSNSNLDEIKKLKELLDIGAITQEEFENKKEELLK